MVAIILYEIWTFRYFKPINFCAPLIFAPLIFAQHKYLIIRAGKIFAHHQGFRFLYDKLYTKIEHYTVGKVPKNNSVTEKRTSFSLNHSFW